MEELKRLKDIILEYIEEHDNFPTFRSLRKKYRQETNKVIQHYNSYSKYLKAYGLYDIKVQMEERQKQEELEVLEELAVFKKNMLYKQEVQKKYPIHYQVFQKYYSNKKVVMLSF